MAEAMEFILGITYFIIGLSCLFRKADWLRWMGSMQARGHDASLVFGMLGVLLGAMLVGFHPVWEGLPMVVTLLGVVAIIEGAIYLLYPPLLPRIIAWFMPRQRVFEALSIVSILLGVFVLYIWWLPAA